MLPINTNNMSLDELLNMYEMLDGNNIEHALTKGQILQTLSEKFADNESVNKWIGPKFGHRRGKSTKANLINLYRCYPNRDYPKNFILSALYELTAPKNDAERAEIVAHLKDKERVNKDDVIDAAAMAEAGGMVEPAGDSCESKTSPTATRSPILSIRLGREKSRRYDVRSKDDLQALLQFIVELAAQHHDPAVLASYLPDPAARNDLLGMDTVKSDASAVDRTGDAEKSPSVDLDVTTLPGTRIAPRTVASRTDMSRSSPTGSH